MAPSAHSHGRSHSLLLVQKLLNLRDNSSPLTLVIDSLNQTAGPLLREFTGRAQIGRTKVIFVSFATIKKPQEVDVFVKARGKSLKALRSEIVSHYPTPASAPGKAPTPAATQKALVVIDSLNPLASSTPQLLPALLSGIITPAVSVVAVYHADVPLVFPKTVNEYDPHPLTLLTHLATAVFRVSSLYQELERQRARNRSLPEPEWGLDEGREGVLIGIKTDQPEATANGVVVEMEMRRRSGRAVAERFILATRPPGAPVKPGSISLLADHPLFASPADAEDNGADGGGEGEMDTTFNLGLTEKQRKDREGIVLPYFDAQTDIGAGEGGRILYDMGREDDFDEEEDEI